MYWKRASYAVEQRLADGFALGKRHRSVDDEADCRSENGNRCGDYGDAPSGNRQLVQILRTSRFERDVALLAPRHFLSAAVAPAHFTLTGHAHPRGELGRPNTGSIDGIQ